MAAAAMSAVVLTAIAWPTADPPADPALVHESVPAARTHQPITVPNSRPSAARYRATLASQDQRVRGAAIARISEERGAELALLLLDHLPRETDPLLRSRAAAGAKRVANGSRDARTQELVARRLVETFEQDRDRVFRAGVFAAFKMWPAPCDRPFVARLARACVSAEERRKAQDLLAPR